MSSTDKANQSKRKQVRYAVSDDCRIKASIKLRSADQATAAKDWIGTLVDVSAEGVHIQISLGAIAYVGDACVVTLSWGAQKAELRGSLAHYVCSARTSVCGVKLDFTFSGADKAYQPFYKAVMASSALKGGPVDSDQPGKYKEEYLGPGHTKLVVWRDNKPERSLVGFEYIIARYGAILLSAGPEMIKNKESVRFKLAEGSGSLTSDQEKEARWEFSVAASNLSKIIPPDIRRFLRLVS